MYSDEQIEKARAEIKQLINIVHNLEDMFKGRHFTLDGHLVGSIGEVMAAYHYGISLYEASAPVHDGKSPDGREVQVKMTQGDTILIADKPDYLIVLHMDRRTGEIKEVYNGPGAIPFERAYHYQKHNNMYMRVAMLCDEDKKVAETDRIPKLHEIQKYQKLIGEINGEVKYKSSVGVKKGRENSTSIGYTNHNLQKNMGITGNEGTMKGQKSYRMHCLICGFEYEANGCDIWLRKCPACQNK